ncbi:LysR substrate-binding domain-containing protein [Nocardioides sp. AE5]|uniref:LysR family substrate-binding domain-containing protein n=1 Tax=Nocardioides sp. AE5 TaxID=2962573 RepID=UPI0028814657|nr:LysR substrate-binding domain-containing protein [Nocardioides sp. AE5]MDT0202948.1 LysR substrate-binding domain-containing protein [Nocardioides sp. AE5]
MRTTRRVELTTAGEAYLTRTREILDAVDDAGEHASRVAAGRVGKLTVGCVGSATYSLLPTLARSLRAELADVQFGFRGEMLSPDQIAALHGGSLDIGLMRTPPDSAGLAIHPVRRDRLIAAVPQGHRLADAAEIRINDLAGEELVIHAGGGRSVMNDVVQRTCRAAGFEATVAHEVAETSTLVTFIAAGLGIAVVPEPTSVLAVPGVAFVPLAEAPYVDLVAVVRADDEAPVLARALQVLRRLRGAEPAAQEGSEGDASDAP